MSDLALFRSANHWFSDERLRDQRKGKLLDAQHWHFVLACLLGCPRRVCQWSTPPHPSWTQPELHHLDTVCWISKFFSK